MPTSLPSPTRTRLALSIAILLSLTVPNLGFGQDDDEAQVEAGFVDPIALVAPDVVEHLIHDPAVRILDARDPKDYRKGHLPTAVNFPVSSLIDETSRIQGSLDQESRLAARFGQRGIGPNTHVVVYDDQAGRLASHVVWSLHYLGHPMVSVLDGGLGRWRAEGRAVTQEIVPTPRETFPFDPVSRRMATAGWILDHMHDPNVILVDTRPNDLYEKDRIPGAVNVPWTATLDDDGDWWQSAGRLRELFESKGITRDKDVTVYAQVGGMSTLAYLQLRALGYRTVRSYAGSWVEWSADYSLPKVGKTPPSSAMLRAIFRTNGCSRCHGQNKPKKTMAELLTDAGKEAASLQNGCVRMLTKIIQIAQNDPKVMAKITEREIQQTKQTFGDHGCAKCHNVEGGGSSSANLNRRGLGFLEMNLGCVDMMFSLNDPSF